jgi:hypothetical protein
VGVPFEQIDWTSDAAFISRYFTVHEGLYLPDWKRLATPDDFPGQDFGEVVRRVWTFANEKVDVVRAWRGKPINVHNWLRPPAYNVAIGGAPHSHHRDGIAVDFDFGTRPCDFEIQSIRDQGMLTTWELRMENNGINVGWIHLDDGEVGPSGRYFRP